MDKNKETKKTPKLFIFFVLYFLANWPFINFVNINYHNLNKYEILRCIFYGNVAFLFLFLATKIKIKNFIFYTIIFWILIFNYDSIYKILNLLCNNFGVRNLVSLEYLIAFSILFIISFFIAYFLAKKRVFHIFLYTLILTIGIYNFGSFLVTLGTQLYENSGKNNIHIESQIENKWQEPLNVYFLVPDGYARQDILLNNLNFDNSLFINELKKRNFTVLSKSQSNYPTTFHSLGSTLAIDFLLKESDPLERHREKFIRPIVGLNPVVQKFKQQGYLYAQASKWITGANCQGYEDICLDVTIFNNLPSMEFALLNLTPLKALIRYFIRNGAIPTFKDLSKSIESLPLDKPRFVFAHSLPPHPPFFLKQDCSHKNIDEVILDEYNPESKNSYVENVKCVNQTLLDLIDQLLAKDPKSIIVIQSDHGSAFSLNLSSALKDWTDDNIKERFSNLSAFRLPQRCQHMLYDSMTNINTFPVIFACLSQQTPHLLPDKRYVTSYEKSPDSGRARPLD